MDRAFKLWFAGVDPFFRGYEEAFHKAYLLGKETRRKAKTESDECYPRFVKLWLEHYPEFAPGFSGIDGRKIKSLIAKTRKVMELRQSEINTNTVCANFEYVLKYLKRSNNWYHGKSLAKFESAYLEIIREITNGKSGKKESTWDAVNAL